MEKLTSIGFQVLRGYHNNETDGPFIAKHLIGPTADGTHTFDCCNAVVGNKHLEKQSSGVTSVDLLTLKITKSINNWLIMLEHKRSWNIDLAKTVLVAEWHKQI